MSKKIIILAVFLIANIKTQAQKKVVLGITDISFVNKKDRLFSNQINEIISTQIAKSNRFTIVDRTKFSQLEKERELQKSEEFMDGLVIQQGKTLGAQYIIVGTLSNINAGNNYDDIRKMYVYSFQMLLALKIINVETGEVVAATNFERTPTGFFGFDRCIPTGYGQDYDSSIQNAMSNLTCGIKKWIDYAFPLEFKLLKIEEGKREKARKVLVNHGTDIGITQNQVYSLYVKKDEIIDGQVFRRKLNIGECKIVSIEDENLSLCEISNGGDTIYKEFTSKNEILGILKTN